MDTKPTKNKKDTKDAEEVSLQERIVKLEKQLDDFKRSNDHFIKHKLFLHYDIKDPEKVVVDCEVKLPVLAEVEKKKIQKGKEEDPTHLLIEGDNYHALSVLNYTHAGKIDLIYIDPPYNTGNKDFMYNDHFVDREDSFRHSKWLSFMAHRLHLAKNLLAETGVIFISIDDNEQAHLRLLCDQIFGEENFVSMLVIESGEVFGTKAAHVDKTFVKVKDYVLVYAKNQVSMGNKQPLYDGMRELYDSHFNTIIEAGENSFQKISFIDLIKKTEWAKEIFEKMELKVNAENINLLMNINDQFKNWVFNDVSEKLFADAPLSKKISQTVLDSHNAGEPFIFENKIIFKTGTGSVRMFLKFKDNLKASDDFQALYSRCSLRGDLWKGFHFDMRNVQDEGVIDFKNGKKPVRLILQLVKWFNKKDSIILDFFAGSGTTGHAVLKLNAQDGGNRQFILCTNNENKIAENVTYPRIKKVIDGYGDNAPIPANLRYFKTDFVEKKGSTSQLKIDFARRCAEMLCVKENVFEEVKFKKQIKNYRFFKQGDPKKNGAVKYLAVFFDFFTDTEFSDFIKELQALPQEAEKIVYVFVLDGPVSIFADEFVSVMNCEIKEIPQKILDIYKQLAREVARK